jgi:tRNA-Thr(GGU) m(6)t(6)A37 methyltransferase TsaA
MGRYGGDSLVSEIIISGEHEKALEGIEQFSHLIIILWMNQVPLAKHRLKKVQPWGEAGSAFMGVLATRTQYWPNPLAVKTVKLLERCGSVLMVMGLHALDGTPVLDIKPYDPGYDGAPEARVLRSVERLRQPQESGEPTR